MSTLFRQRLRQLQEGRSSEDRRWVVAGYDQLSDRIGPLSEQPPERTGLILVESAAKARRRPYHRQAIALILANQRHFALEQAARGVLVRHAHHDAGFAAAITSVSADLPGPLVMMEPAEREMRDDLAPLVQSGALRYAPHTGWLTESSWFDEIGEAPWRMDAFYRVARRRSGILMDGDQPRGGRWSFDSENRKPWRGDPPAPTPPSFTPDPITSEVIALVGERFRNHPGDIDAASLPATADDAQHLWSWAKQHCLPWFGPYEDAMSTRSSGLFHSRISALMNLHRLLPRTVVNDVAAMDIPLSSQEGFIRQVLGWREFVRHVHRATDGFRTLPPVPGVARNAQRSTHHLPAAYWPGAPSGMRCLDACVADAWREAWSHHITRLMVLSNIATLIDADPEQLNLWFWTVYADAFDWVVEPNVLGMGTFSLGPLFTTKPYIAGGAYINRMSDFCRGCRFDPGKDCPVTTLYWDWLRRHGHSVARNPRMSTIVQAWTKRGSAKHQADQLRADAIRQHLADGREVLASLNKTGF
jgi:deoxyribodipyrimidine photolyase-related protein